MVATLRAIKRRAAKLKRTPLWSNKEEIDQFYLNTPRGMTVDHIIPLQGELVSGLHVLDNLQYLTKAENSRKKNKYEVG
jgi:5-methylcytosine-specific restriction endonuclease McrA